MMVTHCFESPVLITHCGMLDEVPVLLWGPAPSLGRSLGMHVGVWLTSLLLCWEGKPAGNSKKVAEELIEGRCHQLLACEWIAGQEAIRACCPEVRHRSRWSGLVCLGTWKGTRQRENFLYTSRKQQGEYHISALTGVRVNQGYAGINPFVLQRHVGVKLVERSGEFRPVRSADRVKWPPWPWFCLLETQTALWIHF